MFTSLDPDPHENLCGSKTLKSILKFDFNFRDIQSQNCLHSVQHKIRKYFSLFIKGHMGLHHEKTVGGKSRDTLPLIT